MSYQNAVTWVNCEVGDESFAHIVYNIQIPEPQPDIGSTRAGRPFRNPVVLSMQDMLLTFQVEGEPFNLMTVGDKTFSFELPLLNAGQADSSGSLEFVIVVDGMTQTHPTCLLYTSPSPRDS